MMGEMVAAFVRANLAAGAAILVVMALRRFVRARFGPEVGYALWAAPALAALASLLPARELLLPAGSALAEPSGLAAAGAALQDPAFARIATEAWAAGALVAASGVALFHLRFMKRAAQGLEGPALVGVVAPTLIVPSDFEQRFTAEERSLIRAHERMHMDRGDSIANALVALVQVACWFNPLAHWAARALRQDQELACDAAVIARRPGMRRRYAEALLKAQFGSAGLPFGCYWPAAGQHPLEERIGLLKQQAPAAHRYLVGIVSVLAVASATAGGAWMAKPVHMIVQAVQGPTAKPPPNMQFVIYR